MYNDIILQLYNDKNKLLFRFVDITGTISHHSLYFLFEFIDLRYCSSNNPQKTCHTIRTHYPILSQSLYVLSP